MKKDISLTKNVVAFHKVLIWYCLPCQGALSGPLLLKPRPLFTSKQPKCIHPQWSCKPWGSSTLELKRCVQSHGHLGLNIMFHSNFLFYFFCFLKFESKDWKFRLSYYAISNTNKNGWRGTQLGDKLCLNCNWGLEWMKKYFKQWKKKRSFLSNMCMNALKCKLHIIQCILNPHTFESSAAVSTGCFCN